MYPQHMGRERNLLFPVCPLTQIKAEELPCQPSSLRGGQDRFQTCIQTDPLEKKIPNHLSDSQPLSAQVSLASHLHCNWQSNSLGPTQATKHRSILELLNPSPFQSVQKKNQAILEGG